MKLTVLIPAHNEAETILPTLWAHYQTLTQAQIPHEILVVDDHSTDQTAKLCIETAQKINTLRLIHNQYPGGFGNAVRFGLQHYSGDCVALVMADGAENPEDVIRFYHVLNTGKYDCIFGSRFTTGAILQDYPPFKKAVNRIANFIISLLFLLPYNDVTNAFKLYHRCVIDRISPLKATQFNLTIELPLKAISYKFRYTVLPNDWYNRKAGKSKLRIRRMIRFYGVTLITCWLIWLRNNLFYFTSNRY